MILTQLVMVASMTMTPVHLVVHSHPVDMAGAIIAIHVAAMYLPSPISGYLVDRSGPARGSSCSRQGFSRPRRPRARPPAGTGAGLLGLGWNLGLVSGTAIIVDAVPFKTRARVQSTVGIAVAGAAGGLASGLVVAGAGYPALATAGGIVALVILPAILLAGPRRQARDP